MAALLFAAVVFCWGFTWFAIRLQLGSIPPEVSIFWRFLLAAAIMWLGLALTGRLKPVPVSQHRWFALLGLCLFGINFVLIYSATQYVASGIVSVIFTVATVFNAFNQWIFLRRPPSRRALAGAACGIGGIGLLFGEAFLHTQMSTATALGVGLAVAGTFVFSLGNLVSLRAAKEGTDLPNTIARGMTWGAVFLALYVAATDGAFPIDWSVPYLGSLAYLAVIGSVAGFLAYLSLVARIGADRAAYATVLFPVVALTVSTVFEGYQWTPWSLAGLPLVLLGNVVIFARIPTLRRPYARPSRSPAT